MAASTASMTLSMVRKRRKPGFAAASRRGAQPKTATLSAAAVVAPGCWRRGTSGRRQSVRRRAVDRKRSVVDWCSGKGHLARVLCHRDCCSSAHCLELDEALCASGGTEHRPSHRFHCHRRARRRSAAAATAQLLRAHGLHACGDLHRRALTTACREQARRIALVPCCYHKVGPEAFSPLSRRVAAESALLPLRTAELQLATAQTASASTAARAREQRWRLAIDAWQREARGEDAYLSAPSAPVRLLRSDAGFAEFCEFFGTAPGRSAAERRAGQRAAPHGGRRDGVSPLLRAGRGGEAARAAAEEVRRQYSRPLELWLCADMLLHLGEEGGTTSSCGGCASRK